MVPQGYNALYLEGAMTAMKSLPGKQQSNTVISQRVSREIIVQVPSILAQET